MEDREGGKLSSGHRALLSIKGGRTVENSPNEVHCTALLAAGSDEERGGGEIRIWGLGYLAGDRQAHRPIDGTHNSAPIAKP